MIAERVFSTRRRRLAIRGACEGKGRMSKGKALERIRRNQLVSAAMAATSKRYGIVHPGVSDGALRLGYVDLEPLEGCVRRIQDALGVTVDGWPGQGFLCALWGDNKPMEDDVIVRTVSCMQLGDVDYVLGAGSTGWFDKELDDGSGADCSAFVAWTLLRRKAGGPDWKNSKGQNHWLHSDSVVYDATNTNVIFRECDLQPWCIFAYGDRGGKQGHVGWVVAVNGPRDIEIIDCSSSQSRRLGDAVRQRSGNWLFNRDDVVWCKPTWWP